MNGIPDVPLPPEFQNLSNLLEECPETLALGNQELQATALNATKYAFDLSIQSEALSRSHVVELMTLLTWTQGPQTRSRANNKQAVEKPTTTSNSQLPDKKNLFDSTPLKSLYIDGMDEDQIWEQLDLRTNTICRVLDFVLEGESKEEGESGEEEESDDENEANLAQAIERLRQDLFAEEEEEVQEEESEEEEEEENDDELEPNPKLGSRQAIELLEHDLFAEEDLEEELQEGESEEEEEEEENEDEDDEANPELGSTRAIERLKHDLFAEEEEEVQDDLTTHEKRMATLQDQIEELESENVAEKDWVLMGEVGSRQRPKNSLLEEDLDFGRVMKAVPVITEEAVHTLEEIIKTRVLEGRYDDVVRLRPLDDKPFLPSKYFELQDSKSTQSLAQIYENDYVSAQSGVSSDDRDGKLKKEHDEISQVWDKICGKLDALCNAHFVPKQPKATISTISNIATATLESALPTSKSTATMLAPEEIFATSSSLQRARSELTPVEKRALRTKERKARQRQRDALNKSVDKYAKSTRKGHGSVTREKEAALKSIVKHGKGVTVVGKKMAKDKKSKT